MDLIDKLNAVLKEIKETFVSKDEIIDLLGISLLARENAFLFGPPGTAKSAIIRNLSQHIEQGNNFEYLLTRFTEPNEIFGPFDVRKLKEGELLTNTEGMLPEASMVFLDELFNANSAILNSLLMALNERIFRRGKETRKLPALMFVGASNLLPEDEALNALLDRFLIRVRCDNVEPDKMHEVLIAGWKLEQHTQKQFTTISADEIRELQQDCKNIDLQPVRAAYIDLVHNLRNTGIKVSDRRAVKLQSLIAASALICKRKAAIVSDLWVLKYIWDTEEQVEILEGMVNAIIEKDKSEQTHPQAFYNKSPNADEVMKEVLFLQNKWIEEGLSLEEKNVVKDKLRYVQSRCDWIQNREQKEYIQKEIDKLWKQILEDV